MTGRLVRPVAFLRLGGRGELSAAAVAL